MDLTDYINSDTVILCASKDEAEQLVTMAVEQLSITRADDMLNAWSVYKENTCYHLNHGMWSYCYLQWFVDRKYDIHRFSDMFAQLEGEDGSIEDLLI